MRITHLKFNGSCFHSTVKVLAMIVTLLILTACNKETLYSNLSEQEANEMIALLHQSGLSATKNGSGDHQFSVQISNDLFANGVHVLRSAGYPKKNLESLGEVFKKEGFVSSPLEERARLNYAQSQELTQTIESIDGVVMARVHLALPEEDPLSEKIKPSSASVFVKYINGTDLSTRKSQIKALLVNSIEGLPYENVTVVLFPAKAMPVFNKNNLDQQIVPVEVIVGVLVFVLCIVAFITWQKRKDVTNQSSAGLTVVGGQKESVEQWTRQSN